MQGCHLAVVCHSERGEASCSMSFHQLCFQEACERNNPHQQSASYRLTTSRSWEGTWYSTEGNPQGWERGFKAFEELIMWYTESNETCLLSLLVVE